MKQKKIFLIISFLAMNVSLVSCKGSLNIFDQLGLSAPAEESASASIEESITETSTMETASATAEGPTPSREPTPTPEEETSAETPDSTEEPSATQESDKEALATEEPAAGFWEVNSPDGQLQTVAPVDWLPINNYEFQTIFNNEGNFEGMDALGLASPDNKAFIYLIAHKDAETTNWDEGIVQAKVLRILNKMFTKGTGDIEIVNIRSMPDGSERLTWSSDACDCTGFITYKTGTHMETEYLWLCNTFYIKSFENNYMETFDYVLERLKFPNAP